MHKKFYSSHSFFVFFVFFFFVCVCVCVFKSIIFTFSQVKNDNKLYCSVGNLETDFQQVPLAQFFWPFHSIVLKRQ